MSSSGSNSGSELDYEEEMALRIALERSKVENGGSSRSGASLNLPRRRSADAGAGPSRPARSDARSAQSAPAPRRLLPPPAAPARGQRWVLAPAPPARTRTPESEGRAARHDRQHAREREAAELSARRRRGTEPDTDEDARLLASVYHRSLATAETDARRLRRKNAKALRLAIEQSEREAKKAAAEKAQVATLKREQDRAVRRMKGLIVLSDSYSDCGDSCSLSSDDQDPLPAADAYSCAGDRKGKGPARKW